MSTGRETHAVQEHNQLQALKWVRGHLPPPPGKGKHWKVCHALSEQATCENHPLSQVKDKNIVSARGTVVSILIAEKLS